MQYAAVGLTAVPLLKGLFGKKKRTGIDPAQVQVMMQQLRAQQEVAMNEFIKQTEKNTQVGDSEKTLYLSSQEYREQLRNQLEKEAQKTLQETLKMKEEEVKKEQDKLIQEAQEQMKQGN